MAVMKKTASNLTKSNLVAAAALGAVLSGAMLNVVRADEAAGDANWSNATSSYWLNHSGSARDAVRITEFTPRSAPDSTCVFVHSSRTLPSGGIACMPKAAAAGKNGGPQ